MPFIFVSFAAILGFFAFRHGIKMQWQWNRSGAWFSTPGIVIESKIRIDDTTEGVSHFAAISYSYEVGGEKYTGERVTFLDSGGSESQANSILAQYPKGSSVTVFYDPKNVSICVLEKKLGWNWLLILTGGYFIGCAIYSIYYFIRK